MSSAIANEISGVKAVEFVKKGGCYYAPYAERK